LTHFINDQLVKIKTNYNLTHFINDQIVEIKWIIIWLISLMKWDQNEHRSYLVPATSSLTYFLRASVTTDKSFISLTPEWRHHQSEIFMNNHLRWKVFATNYFCVSVIIIIIIIFFFQFFSTWRSVCRTNAQKLNNHFCNFGRKILYSASFSLTLAFKLNL